MSSQMMTFIGGLGAALAVVQSQLPHDSPLWANGGIAAILAFLNVYLGYTNTGTSGKK